MPFVKKNASKGTMRPARNPNAPLGNTTGRTTHVGNAGSGGKMGIIKPKGKL